MRLRYAFFIPAFLVSLGGADAKEYSQSVKLSKGKAKVEFTAGTPEGARTGSSKNPRVGIAPSPTISFGNFLAQQLDATGRAVVVPPSRLSDASALNGGFDGLMRSELQSAISGACRKEKLDYLLVLGTPQPSMKTDITAYLLNPFARMRTRNNQESRLYDCRATQSVWVQDVRLETSQSVVGSMNNLGAGFLGGPESERAMARLYVEKLIADMGW